MIAIGPWVAREPPLEPCAVAAIGATRARLCERLRALDEAQLARLRAVANADVLVVLGVAEDLPWVDGATWLGVDPAARTLRVPTTLRPSVPIDWVERAFAKHAPVALLPEPRLVVPLALALPLARAHLA